MSFFTLRRQPSVAIKRGAEKMKKIPVYFIIISLYVFVALTFAQTYPAGMISYWKFDEGDGTAAYDSVGNNDGTIVGSTWTTGQVGGALQFESNGYNHVTVPNHETLNPSHITVEAWVYPTSYGYYRTMVTKRYYNEPGWYAPYSAYQLDPLSYNTLRPGFYVAILGIHRINTTPADVTIDLGYWYHLVGTYDGDKTRIYLNGEFIEEKDVPNDGIDLSSGPLYIGGVPNSNNMFFGKIDEVAIYNRALTPEEIQQHYQNGLDGLGYDYVPPEEMLEGIINTVIALNLQQGISNSVDAKLQSALQAIDDTNSNNDVAAINSLNAFINAVEAQRGNKISEADADELISAAQALIAVLESP
jgi:hypothetical protein